MEETTKVKIEVGIFLSWATLIGYLTAYCYESGNSSYFGVADDFINLGGTRAIFLGSHVVLFLVGLLFIFNIAYVTWLKRIQSEAIRREVLVVFSVSGVAIVRMFVYGLELWREWIGAFAIPILYVILSIVLPLMNFKSEASFAEKVKRQAEVESGVFSGDLFDPFIRRFGRDLLTLAFLSFVVPLIGRDLGRASAIRQDSFYIQSSNPNLVLLRDFGESAIFGEIEPTSRKLIGRYVVVNSDKLSDLTLNYRKVGRLLPPDL